MAIATAMYHSGASPLKPVRRDGFDPVISAKGLRQRRLGLLRDPLPTHGPRARRGRTVRLCPPRRSLLSADRVEVLDELVGNVQRTVDKMLEHADLVEEEALRLPKQATIESVLKLRRSALGLYRIMVSQQGLVSRLARGDFPLVTAQALPYFRDVHEQVWRIVDFTQTLRDRSDSALTTYMSSVAHRQNESMRLLSMVTAIFLPLSLLAGKGSDPGSLLRVLAVPGREALGAHAVREPSAAAS